MIKQFSVGLIAGPILMILAGCGGTSTNGSPSQSDPPASQLSVPASRHVVMVMEENQSYDAVAGPKSAWPNLDNLIAAGALPTNYYANAHFSIGNYFVLTTGVLLTTDDNSTKVWDVDNIARRMLAAGRSFKVYAEGATQGYVGGNTGAYVLRHEPFAMLSDVADDPKVADQVIWPIGQFVADVKNDSLPEFSFIVPDIDHDAHSAPAQQADAWLQQQVITPLGKLPEFQAGGDGLLVVDFDEGDVKDTTYGGGHIAPVLWGPNVKAGYRQTSTTIYQHQSMLRTIMEALQLPNPPGLAATAPSMGEFFVQPVQPTK